MCCFRFMEEDSTGRINLRLSFQVHLTEVILYLNEVLYIFLLVFLSQAILFDEH